MEYLKNQNQAIVDWNLTQNQNHYIPCESNPYYSCDPEQKAARIVPELLSQ